MSPLLVAAAVERPALVALLDRHVAALGRKADAVRLRRHGLARLLDWLEAVEGESWDARWHAAGEGVADWQTAAGAKTVRQRRELWGALETLMLPDHSAELSLARPAALPAPALRDVAHHGA